MQSFFYLQLVLQVKIVVIQSLRKADSGSGSLTFANFRLFVRSVLFGALLIFHCDSIGILLRVYDITQLTIFTDHDRDQEKSECRVSFIFTWYFR